MKTPRPGSGAEGLPKSGKKQGSASSPRLTTRGARSAGRFVRFIPAVAANGRLQKRNPPLISGAAPPKPNTARRTTGARRRSCVSNEGTPDPADDRYLLPQELAAFWTLDASVTWEPFDKRFELSLAAFNLLDEDFEVAAGIPGWGRSFKGTLKVRF